MFEDELKAVKAHRKDAPGSASGVVLIYADTVKQAREFGLRTKHSFQALSYDNPEPVGGWKFMSAILLDPPQTPAQVPRGLPAALAVSAQILGKPYAELIKVVRNGKEVRSEGA